MIFFQQKDCDIHNQQPFFVYKMKIPKKWQIPLRHSLNICNVIVFENEYRRNKLPVHFTNYFPLVHQVRHIHYNFRNTNDLHIFRVKYEYLKKFPFILFPEAWNNFASAYKNEDNPFKFRSELKRDLILKHIEVACKQYGCVNCLYHIAHDN